MVLTTLTMCTLLAHEFQWEDSLLNMQHAVNEAVFMILCISLVCFSGVLSQQRQNIAFGWILIGLCCILILFNLGVILSDMLTHSRLIYMRYKHRITMIRRARSARANKKAKDDDVD